MPGKRGTHDDSDGARGEDRNMPAPSPRKQKDLSPSGKRGTHSLDDSDNTLLRPKELKPGVDQEGKFDFSATKGGINSHSHDPRRSHS